MNSDDEMLAEIQANRGSDMSAHQYMTLVRAYGAAQCRKGREQSDRLHELREACRWPWQRAFWRRQWDLFRYGVRY